uniref:Phosphomevalonate dehydratase large subunit n=1 Tax=Ignisphaera aggregans TaxID=334771 RepID=A0A7C2VLI8_9CREN
MYLSTWEEKALQGEFGEATSIAMNVLTKVCRALKAERLVEIRHAHVAGVSYFNISDEGLELLEELASKGARVAVYTTANPASVTVSRFFEPFFDKNVVTKQRRVIDVLVSMGIDEKSFTCTPYKIRMPRQGEHLAWAESSAVIYANSIAGARTNREGAVVSLMAAITGRTCYCGYHVSENRYPTELIEVEFPVDSISAASAIGLYIGKITSGVPYIRVKIELGSRLRDVAIRSMLASIASTSSSALALIEGISPEAKKIDTKHLEKLAIDKKDLADILDCSCTSEGIEGILVGCPHVDLDEAHEILASSISKLKSLGVKKMFIATPIFEEHRIAGFIHSIEGIEVIYLPGACPVVSNLKAANILLMPTIHGKAYHYLPRLAGVASCILNIA